MCVFWLHAQLSYFCRNKEGSASDASSFPVMVRSLTSSELAYTCPSLTDVSSHLLVGSELLGEGEEVRG